MSLGAVECSFVNLATLLASLLVVFYSWAKYKQTYWSRRGVHSPPAHWLFGHLRDAFFLRTSPLETLRGLYRAGDDEAVVGFYVLQKPFLLLRDHEIVKRVFVKDAHVFPDRYFAAHRKRDRILISGLFSIDSPRWKYLRAKLSPAFTAGKQRRLFELMLESAENMRQHLRGKVSSRGLRTTIESRRVSTKYTTDVISSLSYGVRTNSFDEPEPEFYVRSRHILSSDFRHSAELFVNFFFPRLNDFVSSGILHPYTDYFRRIFWESMGERERSGVKRGDIIDLLVELRERSQTTWPISDGGPSDENRSTKNVTNNNAPSSSTLPSPAPNKQTNNNAPSSSMPSPEPSHSSSASVTPSDTGKKRKRSLSDNHDESDAVSDGECDDEERKIISKSSRQYTTPAQNDLNNEIQYLEKTLLLKIQGRDSGIPSLDKNKIVKEIEELKRTIGEKKKLLDRKKKKAIRQKRYRDETRKTLLDIKAGKSVPPSSVKVSEGPGRPRIEDSQPELLKTIADIAMFGGAAHDRRRSNLVRSCKTLKELTAELRSTLDITISQSATYLRLLPRNSHSTEGKRHVSTVPVKLCKAQNNTRKNHMDSKFCTASIRSLEQLISVLGSKQVALISQDDKSKVPIGLAAANKQAPLLMHLEYRITLPDHDWVIAPRHKLTPSVYAGIIIEDGKIGDPKNVSYSGPTHIAIRSAKHCSSTALSHAYDFQQLFTQDSFKEILYDEEKIKPIFVITSDGGPDENPRYKKVIMCAIHHFLLYNLDAIFIITNAPGRSAYNRVERRMAKFSNELAGVVLPHDHYGSHLNSAGVTIDEDLESKNFEFAGKVLADDIWGKMVIDGYPVTAEYITADCVIEEPAEVSADWYALHVQESQYFLQVVKCDDRECCGEWRSNLKSILPTSNGFLPPPFPLRRSSDGQIVIPTPEETVDKDSFLDLFVRQATGLKPVSKSGFAVPYDFYCPSLRNEIEGRTCNACGIYFASKKQKSVHVTAVHGRKSVGKQRAKKVLAKRESELLCELDCLEPVVEWIEEEDVEIDSSDIAEYQTNDNSSILIDDLHDWLVSPFTLEDGLEIL